ncbi:MAG: enoyl-CoA hydratase/isomerase family protein [Planctomycetia bacterium]|nr:enoyl-CoA hydratase/isomerase family protein [Planctomycetia bacterium]
MSTSSSKEQPGGPLLKVHVHQNVGTIILNRPEKRNALNRALMAELSQALFDLYQERRVRAVILTGAGPALCAGMDLDEMLEASESENPQQQWLEDSNAYHDLLIEMLQFSKPLIAAVNGSVVGGGAGLMLACDIVVAAQDARFGLPEPLRGVVAGMVTPMLVFRIGAGQAARLLLTSNLIDAAEAQRVGLFHEIVQPDAVWARAVEIAAQCARGAPESLQMTKRMLNETCGEHLTTLLSAGAAVSATARTTEAAAEGLRAFREKREPKWG